VCFNVLQAELTFNVADYTLKPTRVADNLLLLSGTSH
jgi:hypothetical protein